MIGAQHFENKRSTWTFRTTTSMDTAYQSTGQNALIGPSITTAFSSCFRKLLKVVFGAMAYIQKAVATSFDAELGFKLV